MQLGSLAKREFGIDLVDATGSPQSRYSFDLAYTEPEYPAIDQRDFLKALTQLGLNVTHQKKYPVDYVVIDHIEEVH